MKVRKAVIAAAGFGTRFLPQTKAMPKEMLPIIDKPIIQYVVEELIAAGVEDIIIVTGYSKRPIEDHFDLPSQDLRANLEKSGKHELLKQVEEIGSMANFIYVRQKGPVGNATPLLNAAHLIGDEPFFYTWGDEVIISEPRQFVRMRELYEKYDSSVVLTMPATKDTDYEKYGFYAGEDQGDGTMKVTGVVEKPGKENAPSNRFSVGGFLLKPSIFTYLEKLFAEYDGSGELIIQKAYDRMLADGEYFVAGEVNGKYHDTGNKTEYVKTVVDFALNHPEIGSELRTYLKSIL